MGYTGRWVEIIDLKSSPREYEKLRKEVESGRMVYSFGPCSVFGEEGKVYRFENKLYKIAANMYGGSTIEILEGAEFIKTFTGKVLEAEETLGDEAEAERVYLG